MQVIPDLNFVACNNYYTQQSERQMSFNNSVSRAHTYIHNKPTISNLTKQCMGIQSLLLLKKLFFDSID